VSGPTKGSEEHNERIRAHFEALAGEYPALKRRNRYYNDTLIRWCGARVPPGRKVLEVGAGRGDVLAAVQPSEGLGIDLSESMVRLAKSDHPRLEFRQQAVETLEGDGSYDAVLLINTLEYMHDVGVVFDRIHAALRDNGRLLISTANPMWSPIFKTASRHGLRIPDCERLFLTNEDIANMLTLHGFETVDKTMDLVIPKDVIPGVAPLANWVVSHTPVLHLAGSTQLIVARKVPRARREYSVSVVVPCYNEVGNVDRCVSEMRKFGSATELIFVDDGSKDGTAKAVKPELNPDIDVRVIRYEPNRGKGHAVKMGFDAAKNDIVMILDADLTTHPEELGPLYEGFARGRAEFVNCTRLIYPMEGGAMKFANYFGNKMFTILVSAIMGARVSDTLCGTKAMFRKDYEHVTMGRDPWGDYDFLFGAAQQRLVIRELPVHYRERVAGLSKMNSTKHTINLLRMCWKGFWQVQTYRPIPAATKRIEVERRGATGATNGKRVADVR
jgi:ubiquinone/menaquinone biosynthesis C-methylase UbiE